MKMNYQKPQTDVFEVYSKNNLLEEMSGEEVGTGGGTIDDSRGKSKKTWDEEE